MSGLLDLFGERRVVRLLRSCDSSIDNANFAFRLACGPQYSGTHRRRI